MYANVEPEKLLREARTIAVVGLSADPGKASNEVASYLKTSGYRVIPVNPKGGEILGERVYKSVAKIPEPVDIVDVFLPAEKTPPVAREAVEAGAGALWLQLGIESPEARRIAEGGGLAYVEDRCAMQTLQGTPAREPSD